MALFNAYQVIHTCCEQNEPLKRSLNNFSWNESFKYFVEGRSDMKVSVLNRELPLTSELIREKDHWVNRTLKFHFFLEHFSTSILQDLARFLQDRRPDLASCKISVICKNLARSCKISVICKNLARSCKISVGVRLGTAEINRPQKEGHIEKLKLFWWKFSSPSVP